MKDILSKQGNYYNHAIEVCERKIYILENEKPIFTRYWWQTLLIGIFACIFGPFQRSGYHGSGKSALEHSGLTHIELMVLIAILYTSVCVFAHFLWKYRDKKKLLELYKKKLQLEKEREIFKG
ncbi:MAG: hypothetical protein R2781_02640 [Flavobacteriaceae bacterium]